MVAVNVCVQIVQINASLKNMYGCGCRGIHYWRHRHGFFGANNHTLYDDHGVHLSDIGLLRYWHSVQAAVGKGMSVLIFQ
jgi:hypothetical protein